MWLNVPTPATFPSRLYGTSNNNVGDGAYNVNWNVNSFDDMSNHPTSLRGYSADEVSKMLNKYEKIREEMYQRFVFTLKRCGKFLLNSTDTVIGTYIFEDFNIGVRSDICNENLEMFIEEGWIDEEIKEKCLQLRNSFTNIQSEQPKIWNVQSVRISKVWLEILELSDEIKSLLYY